MSLYVSEVFGPTIQGEGSLAGRPCAFIRLAGCDQRCSWCDTPYAQKREGVARTVDDIMAEVRVHEPAGTEPLIVLTGGNPCLQDCGALIGALRSDRKRFISVETQGTIDPPWLAALDLVTLSPKPPSSGCDDPDWERLKHMAWRAYSAETKVAVLDHADLLFAYHLSTLLPKLPLTLSVVSLPGEPLGDLLTRWEWLVSEATSIGWMSPVKVLPQLHVLLWGNERGR
jgi:7-carboxy-7-deazaguanine synthase